MSSPSKRKETDLMKLMMNDYQVEMNSDEMKEFSVIFNGPADSPYFGGFWKVNVELPNAYPYSSPSVAFANKIYHPNIDFERGSVCVNLLNQDWSSMSDLVHVFEFFLPQLLKEPNADDAMNQEAANLLMRNKRAYDEKVKEYIQQFAKQEDVGAVRKQESSDEEPSEDYYSSEGEATASGPADA